MGDIFENIGDRRSELVKGFMSNNDSLREEEIIKTLEDNLRKGLIDENLFCNAYDELNIIIKGGKKAVIGEIRNFGGRDYVKTINGWKFHGKGTGEKAQQHKKEASSKEQVQKEATPPTAEKPKVDKPKDDTEHGLKTYDLKKHAERIVAYRKHIEDSGYKYYSDFENDLVNKKKPEAVEIADKFDKKYPAVFKNDIDEKLGLKTITFRPEGISLHDAESIKAGKHFISGPPEIKNFKVKKAADFLMSSKPTREMLKKVDDWCSKNSSKAWLSENNFSISKDGKHALITFSVTDKNDTSTQLRVQVTPNTVSLPGMEEHLMRSAHSAKSDMSDLKRYKMEKELADLIEPGTSSDDPKVDEKWLKVKQQTEDSFNRNSIFADVHKVDNNTVHLTIGHIGKKNNVHDTMRSAAKQVPPSSIGDYKLVPNKVIAHNDKLVDKSTLLKEMLDNSENEYSEYENNQSFTYKYIKE